MDKRELDSVQLPKPQEDQIMLAPGLVDLVRDLSNEGNASRPTADSRDGNPGGNSMPS
jgi:hypothetical protein